ncbi:protein kinase domain-containing protein [[Kitasatospora] papulosa]|uniref:protein kinase domain-containing protein n=1 Tax=[Kitasatospora] papulosa TaxID=1464011 RepID=UPI0036A506F6
MSAARTTGDDRTDVLPPGCRVGDWVVTRLIGSGGWSTVHAARPAGRGPGRSGSAASPPDRGDVALKIMPTAGLSPRQVRSIVESARREVELGRRAGLPLLIGFREWFVLASPERPSLEGAIVLVMERAAGSLRDLIDAGVPETDRGRLIAGICEGLAHLHRSGWVHADLKPENVLLGRDGSVKLSDFGLATELTGTHGYAPPMGTMDYFPPERWKAPLGELGVPIRPTADIWALGVIIHEVFAPGVPLFAGATPLARGAAVQEYGEGRAALRVDHAVPPLWRALATDCLAPTHQARARHTAESLLARMTTADRQARVVGAGRLGGRARTAALATALCGVSVAALCSDTSRTAPGAPPGLVRVYNAERGCREPVDPDLRCSLGLAVDPLLPYTAENVVPTRVWHGDVLTTDCQMHGGDPVVDEEDRQSTRWFRIRLPAGSGPSTAWLPAVRTREVPALPECR